MVTSREGLDLIKEFEGFSAKPYLCPAGIPTIGYGSTIYPDGTKVTLGDDTVTGGEAVELLKDMVYKYEEAINKYVKVDLTQNQFDALISFIYNIGVGSFKTSTLLNKLNKGDYAGASSEFARWNKSKGKVLSGLTKRRTAEYELFSR